MLKNWLKQMQNKWNRSIESKQINQEEMKELLKEGAILIDVRSTLEYQEGHLDGAISLPEYEIKETIEEKIRKEEKIIVYCSSGSRSKKAQKKLEKMGYEQVYNLEGGFFS